MDHPPPSSLNSSFTYAFSYDVFLSFRGSDTRYAFTRYLYEALSDKGFRTFIDDRGLKGGDQITPSLLKAIDDSRIAIPIFSANYASSSFCLDELLNIMINSKDHVMLVVPIFYKIDPSQVRHQKGNYGKALAEHENKYNVKKDKLDKWKWALHEAADLSGHHFKDNRDEYENEFIGKIVKLVSSKINRTPLYVADYPVGLDSRIQQVKMLLDIQPDKGANMVGIHGAGGMGKTILALAIYNFIADQFDGLCFLENVRENSEKQGLKGLQCILLEKVFGEKEIKLASVNEGISILQHRLQQKKVLLILDDVNKQKQLEALAGDPSWFGPDSKVIITTRDKQLLASHEVANLYEVKVLNKKDALELLVHKAFKSKPVDPSYEEILERTVTYASGLPLALEVIGSNLRGKSIKEWESALNKYARISNKEIFEVLKISFEDLDEEEKNVFLDIACCLKGYSLGEVNEILCAHYGVNMKHHTSVLMDKSLVKIAGGYNEVSLHDLIEEMGQKIAQQESPKERSRLWLYEDIVQVLQHSEEFGSVIHLNFEHCTLITEIPNVSGFDRLERLSLRGCKNLSVIHNSVGALKKLKILDAWGCYNLRSFPPLQMTSLEELQLSYCRRLESFPEISARMKYITHINLEGTPIKQFPRSFRNLTGLQFLANFAHKSYGNVGSSFIQSIATMPQLTLIHVQRMEGWKMLEGQQNVSSSNVEFLLLSSCKLTDDFFLLLPTWFANLNRVSLSYENFITVVPECIKECLFLEKLKFWSCWNLQEIRGIPPNLIYFEASDCPKLSERSKKMLLNKQLHQAGSTREFIVPSTPTPIPGWFHHHWKGHSLSFWLRNNELPQLLLCVAVPKKPRQSVFDFGVISFVLFINGIQCSVSFEFQEDHTSLFNLNNMIDNCNLNEVLSDNEWNSVEVKCIDKDYEDVIIESGIYVLKQEGSMEDIRFTDPYEERELEDEGDGSESQNHQLLQEHNPQHMGFWSHIWKRACSCFPFLLPPSMHSFGDNVNEDSKSLESTQIKG